MHVQLISQQGSLEAEKRAQEQRLTEREQLIRDLSTKYQIKGYDYSPLEKEKASEFASRINELLRREAIEAEKIQEEVNAKSKEYQERSRQLHADLERLKQMKSSLRSQITTLQTNIASNESQLDASQTINAELRSLATDMDDKKARLDKVKAEIKSNSYDERIAEKTAKVRSMEEQKDALNQELRSLSLQADMRARLDIKRAEHKSKTTEARNILDAHNAKFRALTGVDANAGNMEHAIERVSTEKDREITDLENQSNTANRDLHQAQSTLSASKVQVKTKQDEIRSLHERIQKGLDGEFTSVAAGLVEAPVQLNTLKEDFGSMSATSKVWEMFLRTGRTRKVCKGCNRGLQEHELPGFESYVRSYSRLLNVRYEV
ncbi:hypothetical protein OE88DRAFT_1401845 [Heliocybe sulcata]|uniref:Uncharacterized protein n=1 Tax=Heliocybe sulcata TaxID=5364 RepID=A0A5C3N446_9AGAM|nr:hypothetical protein OE88DRAFT_1401845 [Heliocybe sulcata]